MSLLLILLRFFLAAHAGLASLLGLARFTDLAALAALASLLGLARFTGLAAGLAGLAGLARLTVAAGRRSQIDHAAQILVVLLVVLVRELLSQIARPFVMELDDGHLVLRAAQSSVVQGDLEREVIVVQLLLDHRVDFLLELACFGSEESIRRIVLDRSKENTAVFSNAKQLLTTVWLSYIRLRYSLRSSLAKPFSGFKNESLKYERYFSCFSRRMTTR